MLSFIRKTYLWRLIRRNRILKKHKLVSEFWEPIIKRYSEGILPVYDTREKKYLNNKKIIWQYWGQGLDKENLPEIVRICFASVDKYKGDFEVIRLSDDTVSDYIEFPEEVLRKLREGIFTRTSFSDLLRLALLNTYGGVWLDATVLLTGNLPSQYLEMDFFMFQRSNDVEKKSFWENIYAYYWGWYAGFKINMLSSIIFSKEKTKIISDLYNILLYLWVKEERYPDYFAFQILFDDLINGLDKDCNCKIVSDTIPHLLQMKLNGHDIHESFEDILDSTTMHKMCYFDDKSILLVKDFVKKYLDIKID